MFSQRELSFVHVVLEIGQGLADDLPAIRVTFADLRCEAVEQTEPALSIAKASLSNCTPVSALLPCTLNPPSLDTSCGVSPI